MARMDECAAGEAGVIPWGSPVPAFGNLPQASVATLGLNPSNREFVDEQGEELQEGDRRFHTLRSLRLESWSEANSQHLERILTACCNYFLGNPYDRWFRRLDGILTGTGTSYYDSDSPACHLDVIPYATIEKWTNLTPTQRAALLTLSHDTLGLLLRSSPVRVLILNGQSVVAYFQEVTDIVLDRYLMPEWSLPRKSGQDVEGVAYHGFVDVVAGYQLRQELLVLGYNHNLQSSFGVTSAVIGRIRRWIATAVQGGLP